MAFILRLHWSGGTIDRDYPTWGEAEKVAWGCITRGFAIANKFYPPHNVVHLEIIEKEKV